LSPTDLDAADKDEDTVADAVADAAADWPSWFRYRTWTPHHDKHSRMGNRVHGTSGPRRRILCDTTSGAADPAPPYSNLMKRFANWNACYSCGFDIPDGHTSQTCPQHLRKPDHEIHFTTRQNAQQYIDQGYNCATKNRHKTVFPQTM
jgi:hypothetical protein